MTQGSRAGTPVELWESSFQTTLYGSFCLLVVLSEAEVMLDHLESLAQRDGNIGSTRSTATILDSATWKVKKMGTSPYPISCYIYLSEKVKSISAFVTLHLIRNDSNAYPSKSELENTPVTLPLEFQLCNQIKELENYIGVSHKWISHQFSVRSAWCGWGALILVEIMQSREGLLVLAIPAGDVLNVLILVIRVPGGKPGTVLAQAIINCLTVTQFPRWCYVGAEILKYNNEIRIYKAR